MALKVNGDRLWSDLMTMATIAARVNGGSYRTALSDADRDPDHATAGANVLANMALERAQRLGA